MTDSDRSVSHAHPDEGYWAIRVYNGFIDARELRSFALSILCLVLFTHCGKGPQGLAASPPPVVITKPTVQPLVRRLDFLGQFSAFDSVEIRAQVGGLLSQIRFRDGEIVKQGELLFVIDTRPYQIRLDEATAALKAAQSHLKLAKSEYERSNGLVKSGSESQEELEQRLADLDSAQAAVDTTTQTIRDAQLDLEYCHITAPFAGRMSTHRVSVGNLISGSRAGVSQTTLLTTIVKLDPIYLDFDMSENDYLNYQRAHGGGAPSGAIAFRLSNEQGAAHHGNLDFVDNAINRSSGTIHARATVTNSDLTLVPGEFAHVDLGVGDPRPTLLIPEVAIGLDQSQHYVLTVGADDTVTQKTVELGAQEENLRVIEKGLDPQDRVIIEGMNQVAPGMKVSPKDAAAVPVTAQN